MQGSVNRTWGHNAGGFVPAIACEIAAERQDLSPSRQPRSPNIFETNSLKARGRPLSTQQLLLIATLIPVYYALRQWLTRTSHKRDHASRQAAVVNSSRYALHYRDPREVVLRRLLTRSNVGEIKDFEVYSCHVSPDGKRLVTAAGGTRDHVISSIIF